MAKIKITQTRSTIKRPQAQRLTLKALGLHKIHQSVEQEDSETIKGMIRKVAHLVKVEAL
ncbi:50S ribosomal protein L30 [Hugenholtzia roseola]|uniref:50S ribosomal protein L30 n=1 Tax=Hugenholtzia roseola TaxID=1002 RepID=UPI000422EB80|nr:50S ribosomal protein L30 [Hugenholtzia roseola]